MNGRRAGAGFLLTVASLGSAASADVNLEFRTDTPVVAIGDVVQIHLYAVSDDGGKQGVSAMDAIFTWDPAILDLLGAVEGPVGSAGFLEDPGGVNETIPPADGDGLLIYFAPFSTPLQATPEGALVATLEFLALLDTPLTAIDLIFEAGDPTVFTRVFDDKAAGLDILGTLAGTEIVVLPEPIGGCCLFDGSCVEGTVGECAAAAGVYQGDMTACAGVACPQPDGACCFVDGACAEVTEEDCDAMAGVFGGDFTACDGAGCPQPGVCCLPDGSCEFVAALGGDDCLAAAGTYQGDDSDCDAVSCPQPGACCFDDATCIEVRPADCAARAGSFQGETVTCAVAACEEVEGACCLETGGCIAATPSLCRAVAGAYQGGGSSCGGIGCPPPSGGCCLPGGGCLDVPASLCADLLGTFLGTDAPCATSECPGPGEPRLEIDLRPESMCAGAGGLFVVELFMRDLGDFEAAGYQAFLVFDPSVITFLSAAYSAEPFSVPIIDPITATEAGTIKIAAGINPFDGDPTSEDALLVTLLFVANAGSCEGEILSFFDAEPPSRITDLDGMAIVATATGFDCQDVYCPLGACCLFDGTCVEAVVTECVDMGGAYEGDGSACDDVECPQPAGGCCRPSGACDVVTPAQCDALGGTFLGAFSTCDDAGCAQPGACCLPDSTCAIANAIGGADCGDAGGLYQGDDTTCDTADCAVSAGCPADVDGDGTVAFLDLVTLLASWGACNACPADIDGDGEVGFLDLVTLLAAWGPCPSGACCLADGTCAEAVTAADCAESGGAYQGDGTVCGGDCP